tara:strand:- start:621 stop:809 length:189 start_codon:yes stop_codon:yes gene_type:complete
MKAGDLFIDVITEKPVVILGSEIKTINYGTVVANLIEVIDAKGRVRSLEIRMLRSLNGKEKN